MLREFVVENYLSYKGETSLSFVASSIRQKDDYTFLPSYSFDTKLLKSIALYGYNSSGKSNLLKALGYLKYAVLNSNNSNFKFDVTPYLLEDGNEDKPTKFELVFFQNDTKYRYRLEILNNIIFTESLYYSEPKVKESHLFVRSRNDILINKKWNKKNKSVIESFIEVSRSNTLFLSTLDQLNLSPINDIVGWFKKLVVVDSFDENLFVNFTASLISNEYYKHNILSLLRAAKFNIENIIVKLIEDRKESKKYSKDFLSYMLDDELGADKTYEIKVVRNFYKQGVISKTQQFDLLEQESSGTRKYFGLIGFFIEAILKKKVIVMDELDAKFDSQLLEALLLFFNDKKFNTSNAQLLFSSHNTYLLKKNTLRRDQIYILENTEGSGSTLNRMHGEKKLVRSDKSVEKEYFNRKGESPQLDLFFTDGSLGFDE